jgi:hypothetical protein
MDNNFEERLSSLDERQVLELSILLLEKAIGPTAKGRIATRAKALLEQPPLDLQRRAMEALERIKADGKSDIIESLQTWSEARSVFYAVVVAMTEHEDGESGAQTQSRFNALP